MLQTDFIKSLQSSYERVLLKQKPDERKYQYCILSRGGIKGLLPCSLRYINGSAYLYYDITSKQNVAQLYRKQPLNREWFRTFFWSYGKIKQELGRFLLDEENIILHPEQIFQDIGSRVFSFLYLPYCEEESGFLQLLDFMLERMDYKDDALVECIYKIYEQYEQSGEVYLQEKLFEDIRALEEEETQQPIEAEQPPEPELEEREALREVYAPESREKVRSADNAVEKKKVRFFRIGKKKKEKEQREAYYREVRASMEGYAVAEDDVDYKDEEYGRTVYIEETPEPGSRIPKLYTPDGRVAAQLDSETLTVGKQKEEVDFVLEKESVSRVHARIFREGEMVYLEDLNSTNGTFKNGLRLQPYEKRRLEEGDEIRFGRELFIFR